MTQAERLIRNLCEERRLQLVEAERQAIRKVPDATPWKELPESIRKTVGEIRILEKRVGELKTRLRQAGYHQYSPVPGKALHRTDKEQKISQIKAAYGVRREKITALRTTATVNSLGMSATDAKAILLTLQTDLAKV